jgi:CBS domain-containing protein
MHVEHFMTKNPVACDARESLRGVAQLMRDKGVGSIVVLRSGKVAGLVTDRQLGLSLADGIPAETTVDQVMTENPACLTLEDNVFSAVYTLRSAGVVRRVPVVNANRELLGVVSISDIAVIARDLVDAVLLDETHTALNEARILTGAKRVVDEMRRPTKMDRLPRDQDIRPVTAPTPSGPSRSGGAGDVPRQRANPPPTGQAEPRPASGGGLIDMLLGKKPEQR